jgi:hypothetical protein
MWLHKDVGVAVRSWTVKLGAHDVAALIVKDAEPEPKETGPLPCARPFLEWQCMAANKGYILDGNHIKWGFETDWEVLMLERLHYRTQIYEIGVRKQC